MPRKFFHNSIRFFLPVILPAVFLVTLLFSVQPARAANISNDSIFTRGLVPCGNEGQSPCTACDIFALIQNVIEFLWKGSVIVAVLFLMYGGALYMISKPDKARKILTNTAVGILIAFGAWLLVDTALKLIVGRQSVGDGTSANVPKGGYQLGPWNEIKCEK